MPLWCEMPNLSIAEGQKIMKLKTELFGSDHVGFRTIGYDQKEDKMLHLDMEFLHTRTVILETDEHFNPIRPYCVSGCTPLDCETE